MPTSLDTYYTRYIFHSSLKPLLLLSNINDEMTHSTLRSSRPVKRSWKNNVRTLQQAWPFQKAEFTWAHVICQIYENICSWSWKGQTESANFFLTATRCLAIEPPTIWFGYQVISWFRLKSARVLLQKVGASCLVSSERLLRLLVGSFELRRSHWAAKKRRDSDKRWKRIRVLLMVACFCEGLRSSLKFMCSLCVGQIIFNDNCLLFQIVQIFHT